MSWNSTVTCSWCYKDGHNKIGCPERKEYIKENPDGYEARRDEQHKAGVKQRACSYCKETGHNRKTCKEVKIDTQKFVKKNIELRATVLNWMKERGAGIGSLLKMGHNNWSPESGENELMLVDGIMWDCVRIDHWSATNDAPEDTCGWRTVFFEGQCLGHASTQRYGGRRYASVSQVLCVAGKVDADLIGEFVPEGWKTATDEDTVYRIAEEMKNNTMSWNRTYTLCDM